MKLRIEKSVYGGAGLARQSEGRGAGRAVFVPFTIPGELVEAKLIETDRTESAEKKSGHDEAALLDVLEASPHRVKPACPHFGQCGGCQYQHADYPTQLAIKKEILHETLERAGINEVPEIAVHAAEPWGYRNRIRLRINKADGQVEIGYNRRGTNEFLPIQHCPIAAPLLWRAALAFKEIGAEASAAGHWAREAAEVEFFCSGGEEKLQMTVFITKERIGGFSELCERLRGIVPELAGAAPALITRETQSRKAQKAKPLEGWGVDGLVYTVANTAANEDYWVGRGSFFQMNRFLIDEMVDVVTKGRKGQLAWDLYAGVGLFSRVLARGFNQVTAVEVAGSELTSTFKGPGRKAVTTTAVDFLRRASIQRDRPELVVMDPPRAGVGAEVCSLLAKLQPQEIVYVSCDPVTLARDLKLLLDSGYRAAEAHLLDMFPQTFHLETIVVLKR